MECQPVTHHCWSLARDSDPNHFPVNSNAPQRYTLDTHLDVSENGPLLVIKGEPKPQYFAKGDPIFRNLHVARYPLGVGW